MADKTISGGPPGGLPPLGAAPDPTSELPIDEGGATYAVTVADLGDAVVASFVTADLGTDVVMAGTLAARPAAGTAGRLYLATNDNGGTLYRDNGATWVQVASPVTLSAATTSATGVVELATDAETQTGTDTDRAVTPAALTARTATTTRTGIVELATDAETQTGTDTDRAVTPAALTAWATGINPLLPVSVTFASPPPNWTVGATALSSPATATEDLVYIGDLTVSAALNMNGFRLFVAGTLTVQSGGSVHANAPASEVAAATGSVGGGSNGGAGSTAVGNNGATSFNTIFPSAAASAAGTAGATGQGGGGGNGASGSGGTGGQMSAPSAANGVRGLMALPILLPLGRGINAAPAMTTTIAGSGGGSGGGDGGASGRGGGGGGFVVIVARRVVVDAGGTISANGANGYAAPSGNRGGGGGGGGGVVAIICGSYSNSGTVTASGGSGGAGSGTGTSGANGGNGYVIVHEMGGV